MSLSIEHEAPIELCQRHPRLLPKLLGLCGQSLPEQVVAESVPARFNQTQVPKWESDNAALLKLAGAPIAAIVLEIQRAPDADKHLSWPIYTAALHARYLALPTHLLCIATNRPTATWARQPIATCQPHAPFVPLVVGPDELPRLASVAQAAADLPLAMLATFLHISDERGEVDASYALQATHQLAGRDTLIWFCGLLRGIVSEQKLQLLEEMIKMLDPFANYVPRTEWEREHFNRGISEGKAQGKAEGQAEGKAQGQALSLLRILGARGLAVSAEQRRRIEQCSDVAVLEQWIDRALTVRSTARLFATRA